MPEPSPTPAPAAPPGPPARPPLPAATPDNAYRLLAIVRGPTLAPQLDRGDEVPSWPALLLLELTAAVVAIGALWTLALLFDAPLEEPANPAVTPNPAKAPWYFSGLQELLVYFDPWIAGVMVPTVIVAGLCSIPYLDSNPRGTGRYALRERPLATTVFTAGLALWFALILVGQLLRGPSWAWYWPWESWAVEQPAPPPTSDLPFWGGAALLLGTLAASFAIPRLASPPLLRSLGAGRYAVFAVLLWLFLLVPLKIGFRLIFGVKYFLVLPWLRV